MGVFSPSGPGSINTSNTDLLVSVPSISHTQLSATPGTEASIVLPAGTKRFRLRAQDHSKLQLAYSVSQSGTNYWTVMPGNIYAEELLDGSSSYTIYIQSNKASTIVELVSWA